MSSQPNPDTAEVVPESPWRDKDFFEAHQDINNRELSRTYGGTESVWRRWRKKFHIKKSPSPNFNPQTMTAPLTDEEAHDIVERETKEQKLQRELSDAQTKLRHALRGRSYADDLIELAAEVMPRLSPVTSEPPKAKPRANAKSKSVYEHEEAALLRFADWHCDEYIDPLIMEGLNAYDPLIACRRVQAVVDKTIAILLERHRDTHFHTLYIHDFGDTITGALHEENKFTNSIPTFQAMVFASDLKARAVRDLAGRFDKVVFRAVPGNHWRPFNKVPWKMPTENSDYLINNFMMARLADVPNIEFEIPKGWSHWGEIEGWGFALHHGYSDAKGGFGGLSYYSITRNSSKRDSLDSRKERVTNYREYGHMHQEAHIPRNGGGGRITMSPSLCGGNEFAKEGMAGLYSDPGQLLSAVNASQGIFWDAHLNVSDYDYKEECRYDEAIELLK